MTRFFFIPIFVSIVGIGSVHLESAPSWNLGQLREDRNYLGKLREDRNYLGKLGEDKNYRGKLGEDRSNLTVRVTGVLPSSWNYTLYVGGSEPWLSQDPTQASLLPMRKVSSERWEFDLSYNNGLAGYSCNNCFDNNKFIQTGESLEIRLYASVQGEMIPMVGAMAKVTFPISATSSAFENPPEVVIAPNFDNLKGDVHSFSAVHPLFGERKIAVYLPPGFHNPHKQFPVTIAIDVNPPILEGIADNLNSWFTTSNMETIILGFGDWSMSDPNDRANLLTPTQGDAFVCKAGDMEDLCGGCLPDPEIVTIDDLIKCCDVIREGGGADMLLDWLLGDIMTQLKESFPGRVLTGRDHLGVVGYSLGGLFSCHAAWTRDQVFSRAACQSSSFWWPTNASISANEFQFVNKTLEDSKLSTNRFPQRILIDVGEDEQLETMDDVFWMVGAAKHVAKQIEKLPFFYEGSNVWVQVYPGKTHSLEAWIQRLWNALKIIWN